MLADDYIAGGLKLRDLPWECRLRRIENATPSEIVELEGISCELCLVKIPKFVGRLPALCRRCTEVHIGAGNTNTAFEKELLNTLGPRTPPFVKRFGGQM